MGVKEDTITPNAPKTPEEARNWWPFLRADGKVLDALHRKVAKSQAQQRIREAEDALL